MLGIRYLKASPTTYVMHYRGGQLEREGRGLSFFYFSPTSVIVSVPLGSADVPFVFHEATEDFQDVTLQGQLSYRITDPVRIAALLDYRIDPQGCYQSDDHEQLEQRLVHLVQVQLRNAVQCLSLREVLLKADGLVRDLLETLPRATTLERLGVEVIDVVLVSVKATPEMARALEAHTREDLQRAADEAIYARRNAAVEQERIIKENELNTQIAVEGKKREIRERRMAGAIAVEEKRSVLIENRTQNERKEADSRAYAIQACVGPLRDVDWRLLTAIGSGGADSRTLIAMAFRDLADNAQKIGEINMSPDLLRSLIDRKGN